MGFIFRFCFLTDRGSQPKFCGALIYTVDFREFDHYPQEKKNTFYIIVLKYINYAHLCNWKKIRKTILYYYLRHTLIFSVLTYFRYISDASKTGKKICCFKSACFKPSTSAEIPQLPLGAHFSVRVFQVPAILKYHINTLRVFLNISHACHHNYKLNRQTRFWKTSPSLYPFF